MKQCGVALILVLVAVACLGAPMTPSSYTAPPGEGQAQGGSFNYFDETGTQLTDGVYGVDDWTANLGNGNAYEWVGWLNPNPTITFNFPSVLNISQVLIGFSRGENAGIYLPASVNIEGANFSLAGNELANGTRGDLAFNVNLTGVTSVTITLSDAGASRWIFVDEIRFDGTSEIPEPGTLVLAWMGLAAGWVRLRRRPSCHRCEVPGSPNRDC